jgi:long-chain acyl-CoA synthetase
VEKIWLEHYPEGVPAEIECGPEETLVSMMERSFSDYADRPAFACMGRTLTYRELDQQSRAFGAWLQKAGIAPGSRVAIMLPNILQYPVVLCGALRAGMTVVNVNPLYTARELEHQLTDSGAEAIVILANFAHVLEKVIDRTAVKTVIVTEFGDLLSFPKSTVVNFVLRYVKKLVPDYTLAGHWRFDQVLSEGRLLDMEQPPIDGETLAFLQYTGGTTGPSKGAMLTHGSVRANVLQMVAWTDGYTDPGREVIITALPLYHIFALVCNCMCFFHTGGLNVLIPNPRDVPGFVKEMGRWDFTVIFGVNTLFNALLAEPSFQKLDFSHLKMAGGGGMAVQSAVAERWHAVTGALLQEGYGLTECSPVVSMNPREQSELYTGTVGMPLPSTEVSIRDEAGNELPIGERGELCVRGPQVMKGYWRRESATAETFHPDGFLRTGDVAVIDERGFVSIVDRAKDMVLVSGFNVYPCEVEEVVTQLDGVLEAACIGVPDEKSTEAVKVFVVPEPGRELDRSAVIDWCREHMTAYKVPKHVEFRDELPKTNVGKILRRALREG